MTKTQIRIPFHRPWRSGHEETYVRSAIDTGLGCGGGHFSKACEGLLESMTRSREALLTPSGTHALELAALLVEIGPGDEFVVPSFTFVSSANAFVLRGARPVFADVDPQTLCLCPASLASVITPKTKAVVVVHYGGVAAEMTPIMAAAGEVGATVIEDNAHSLMGAYRGRSLGSIAPLAALSFHATKNFGCSEGGALLINDDKYSSRAAVLRDKGTNRQAFLAGQVDKYTWVDVGSSLVTSELQAAYLRAQLEARDQIQSRRRELWHNYQAAFEPVADRFGIRLQQIPDHCESAYHLFYLLLPDLRRRDGLIGALRNQGIVAAFHYVPLHSSPMGRRFQESPVSLPITEDVGLRLVRLPFYTGMTPTEQEQVINAVLSYLENESE